MKVTLTVSVELEPGDSEAEHQQVIVQTPYRDEGSLPWDQICAGVIREAIAQRLEKRWSEVQ